MAGRTLVTKLGQRARGPLLIACKRSELNHYQGTEHGKLEEVPLASKGWNHGKARNDHFTVLPLPPEAAAPGRPFGELGIDGRMVEALQSYNIHNATEFQEEAVATLLGGKHALLAAETGCGKTAAYLVPLIQRLRPSGLPNAPRLVVLVPNRELAHQVGEMAASLCGALGLSAHTLVGGKTKQAMLNPQFAEVDVLVATPGVLGKLSSVGIYKLADTQALVLDEADSLTDDSFAERVESLVRRMPQAQLALVSATLPRRLPDVLQPYSETMERVVSPLLHRPLLHIRQHFMRLTRSLKPASLLQLVKGGRKEPLLVFSNRNPTCKWLAMFLRENGIACSNISGDMNHALRIEQWGQFVRGESRVLSATDVGSRGLNTIQVGHVVNYDFPLYPADYIHRVGRVGRLGSPASCQVTNFVASPREIELVQQIELSVRRDQPLEHVDGNITHLLHQKILRQIRQSRED
ncbi:hypothetical protein HUJ05_011188 [Dendroctonus ponderosae]|nr:hypothetical protein HUJ05_011188 [Dendroctonus ponderosae]